MKDTFGTHETELSICVTCRRRGAPPDDARRPGQALYDAIMAQNVPQGLRVTPVECLETCSRPCTVAFRGGEAKWTYLFSTLGETGHAGMILCGAAQYHAAPDGVIPWRDRSGHFSRNCLARVPPLCPKAP